MSDTTDTTLPRVPRKPKPVVKRLKILPLQAEQIEYDEQWGAARGGTRAGKSVGFALWLFFKRIQPYPRANHIVVGADYEQLRRGFFDLMVGVLESMGWREGIDYRYRESPSPTIYFDRFGKHVRLRSLSTRLVERIRGMSIQTLVLEEPQTWGTSAHTGEDLYTLLVGRLSHSQTTADIYPDLQPQGRMSFNPPAQGHWLWHLIEEQWKLKQPTWKCWRFSVRNNDLLLGKDEYIRGLEAAWHPRLIPSEVDGHWRTGGGNTYYGYEPEVHCNPPEGIPLVDAIQSDAPIIWTHDFNVNKMCSVIAQIWKQERRLKPGIRFLKTDQPIEQQFEGWVVGWQRTVVRALDQIILPDDLGRKSGQSSSVPQVLAAFLKTKWFKIALDYQKRTGKAGLMLFGDPAGHARQQGLEGAGRNTNWKILVYGLRDAGLQVETRMTRQAPLVFDKVNNVNSQFKTEADGYGTTVDPETCSDLANDWREVRWLANGRDIDKHNLELTHSSDAWGYFVQRIRSSNFVFTESGVFSPPN